LLGFTSTAINAELGTSSQQLQPLRFELHAHHGDPGDVAARPVEAGNEGELERVGGHVEDDWNGRRCRLGGHRRRGTADRNDRRNVPVDQLRRQRRQAIVMTLRPAVFEPHILTFDIAGRFQALMNRGHIARVRRGRRRAEKTDYRHLLRARRERPGGRRAADERDELPPFHSITSSAVAASFDHLVGTQS